MRDPYDVGDRDYPVRVAGDERVETARAGSGGGLVGDLLADVVRSLVRSSSAGERPTVLDCGGGSGRFAVPLALAGARVTVVDISADALATLRRRAAEAGVASEVTGVGGDVETLADIPDLAPASFDLVLAHGILESVDRVAATLAAIVATLRPGGLLSVLVANPVAVVLARAVTGDVTGAEREFARLGEDSTERAEPTAVQRLCTELGLVVEQLHGIGVFRDLVPGRELEAPGAREALARLEVASAQRSPFAEIATRVHVLARKPAEP